MLKIKVSYCMRWNGGSQIKEVEIKADYTSDNRILQLTAEKLEVSQDAVVVKGWEAV